MPCTAGMLHEVERVAMIDTAVILVGGKGSRLGALGAAMPKPLLPVGGRPFLRYLIEHLARHGMTRILLCAGYRAEAFDRFVPTLADLPVRVEVIVEPEPAGTGGVLALIADRLPERFLMLNGDSWFDFNLLDLCHRHPAGSLAHLALRTVERADRYELAQLVGDRITGFLPRGSLPSGLINGGIYSVDRAILSLIDQVPLSLEQAVFPVLAAGGRLSGTAYAGNFIDIGVPSDFERAQSFMPAALRRPALFLDRDGVLNQNIGYAYKVADLRWIDGAPALVKTANDAGWYVFVVTNQSGIARGYYTEADLHRFHAAMQADLRRQGAHIDRFYHCPHHPDGNVPALAIVCDCRKPAPGMIEAACAQWPVDRAGSLLIGDKPSDLAAARAAGIAALHFDGTGFAEALKCLVPPRLVE